MSQRKNASVWADRLSETSVKLTFLAVDLGKELFHGVRANTMPLVPCFIAGTLGSLAAMFALDRAVFRWLGIEMFYPVGTYSHIIWRTLLTSVGFLGWAAGQLMIKRRLMKRLSDVFVAANLKNALGKLPSFIFDHPIDAYTRKMRLTRNNLSVERFRDSQRTLESALQVYVDEVREDREGGTVDLIYSHKPMPTSCRLRDIRTAKNGSFMVGVTRADKLFANLTDVPHVLVAGQTGGGKSTFIRQVITTLYLSNQGYTFTLIDLKDGLEFQLFGNLERIKVIATADKAVGHLVALVLELKERSELLRANKCADLASYLALASEKRVLPEGSSLPRDLSRHIVAIDEIAELFLAGGQATTKEVQQARDAVSKIARLGRAVGLHLIVGTQRPDSRALDTQIKANLPGKICFPMSDHASSMVVLGNGRARDLPPIAGRGIWQNGLKMIEVQTPLLEAGDANSLLAPFRLKIEERAEPVGKATQYVRPEQG